MQVPIASDHAGVDLKARLQELVPNIQWQDLGPASKDSVDYPDFADKVAQAVQTGAAQRGLLICGSGQGMVMRANKYSNVRAALVWTSEVAKVTRQHNDANILCLPARFMTEDEAVACVRAFFGTEFEGGRHSQRVAKISKKTDC